MPEIELHIIIESTDNDAFQDGDIDEVVSILQKYSDKAINAYLDETKSSRGKVMDRNGNSIGHWELTLKEGE